MKNRIIVPVVLVILTIAAVYVLSTKAPAMPIVYDEPTGASVVDNLENSAVYTDDEFSYTLNIPEGFKIERQNEYSILITPDVDVIGVGFANFIYVSIVPPDAHTLSGEIYNYNHDHLHSLSTLRKEGDSVNLAADDVPDLEEWFTYTFASTETIDGVVFKNYQNEKPWEFPSGTTENRYISNTHDDFIYVLGYYTGGDSVSAEEQLDPRTAYAIIKSFKLP